MKKLEKLITDSRNSHVFMKPNLEEDSSTRWVNKQVYDSLTIFNGTSLENITYKEDLKCNLVDDKLILYGMTYAELEDKVKEILVEFAEQIKRDDVELEEYEY